MRRVLTVAFLLAASPQAAVAAEHASLWVGDSGLQAKLTQDGNDYVLRAAHNGLFGDLFSGIARGTVLLRAHRHGEALSGTAYVFSPGCTHPYDVRGSWQDNGTRIVWSGQEPKDKHPGTCRVTTTALTTTSVRLKSVPPPSVPVPPPPPMVAQASPPHSAITAPSHVGTTVVIAIAAASVIAFTGFLLRLAYLHNLRANRLPTRPLPAAPREPASAFSSSLPSSSGKLFGSRTDIIKADSEFVRQHVQWLLQRTAQSNAAADLIQSRLRLVEMLSQLATVPALMNHADPNTAPSSFTLSLAEIEQMIASMPEVAPELRGALLRLLAARLKEKLQ